MVQKVLIRIAHTFKSLYCIDACTMAQQAAPIAHDLMDEPHVAGRRVSVLQLYERVEELGLDPHDVADQYDLDVAEIYYALAYYHANPEEMQRVREERETTAAELRERADQTRPEGVTPSNTDSE
ncbi:DUF433 domain-containing protein [Salinirubellus sp. GCM10025818]|uniref:DUF433 domain-containing protein n=1 Tax=Salinirubellus TaxID=2162630 RepID=UPI0030D0A76F